MDTSGGAPVLRDIEAYKPLLRGQFVKVTTTEDPQTGTTATVEVRTGTGSQAIKLASVKRTTGKLDPDQALLRVASRLKPDQTIEYRTRCDGNGTCVWFLRPAADPPDDDKLSAATRPWRSTGRCHASGVVCRKHASPLRVEAWRQSNSAAVAFDGKVPCFRRRLPEACFSDSRRSMAPVEQRSCGVRREGAMLPASFAGSMLLRFGQEPC